MSRWKDYFLCISLLYMTTDVLHAKQQAIFIPSEVFSAAKTENNSKISIEDSTHALLSTENENHDFHYREPVPTHEEADEITELSQVDNSTSSYEQSESSEFADLLQKQSNDSNLLLENIARHISDRKIMQSLVHLIPPNLWAQIQNQNRSFFQQNQTQYVKHNLPNPVILAEAAAQAGLAAPRPYPVPEHLWPRNPLYAVTKPFVPPQKPRVPSTTTTLRPRPFVPIKAAPPVSINENKHSLFTQIGFSCPYGANDIRYPDRRLCNMYFTCSLSGLPEPNLCPEGYLFSDVTRDCEIASRVNCGDRLSAFFEVEETKSVPPTTTSLPPLPPLRTTTASSSSRLNSPVVNATIECALGEDGYYEDPLYCNIYHHCIGGIDYIEPCPNQLAWNEKRKMCDWAANVNCTGKTMPVVQSKTSFCTNRPDGRYASETYCNVFHHCNGGTDNIVRCTGELQWDDAKKECGWKSSVRCGPPRKMLPNDSKFNSTFCTGKPDGSYPNEEYCNVYHVCESGSDSIRQCPNQLFWDNEQQKCEWSNKVHCSGRTLVALSMESNVFCMEKSDGYYIDPHYCNVYHQCMADIDVKLQCPERLVFNETLKRCDWPETTNCKSGNILVEDDDNNYKGFCADKPNGNFAHERYCNRYYICQNGKDVVFTCQNNLRYSIEKNECDWAINVKCHGKEDYMWEGIQENFCKRLPDGNYPDTRYCNKFHQCQAAMDYPKRCPNRLMFNEETKECDWEDKVNCKNREKFIDTEGLDEAVRPGSNNTRGRSTKFCMVKENGDYADLYYCNVYHNCHGGFDTIQYCGHGLVWRQESDSAGRCDWSKERTPDGVDCEGKALFFAEKLGETDILSNLRSEFCISKGPGLYEHQRYCDLYLQCNEQGVGVTMECSPGLVFNEKKKECDYQGNKNDESTGTLCLQPRSFLRSKPKAEQASILFEGTDATGQFPTHFDCNNKNQQSMFGDSDWCNIYHVCVGSRDNIFLCPPGTIFNETDQGCMNRFDGTNCNGTRSYYKPTMKRQKRDDMSAKSQTFAHTQQMPKENNDQIIPKQWKKFYESKQFNRKPLKWSENKKPLV